MAGFKTHITVSSAVGIGYGTAGFFYWDMPLPSAILAGGLCSVSGMLPDLDSDSGTPLRESIALAAAVVPMMLVHRLELLLQSTELVVLAGAFIYCFIRFGFAQILREYTVHRGMFHSIPAALIAAEVAFLLCSNGEVEIRYYKAGGVLAGFLSHLILDEIWSITVKRGHIALKSSFGTALKLWGDSTWANLSCYAKLAALTWFMMQDPTWMQHLAPQAREMQQMAEGLREQFLRK
ncbi:MAG: metal-dependent hydrolase [Pirellulales bacterium]|nr:metal-dependent hydrolase [Pirellulales bacterium]